LEDYLCTGQKEEKLGGSRLKYIKAQGIEEQENYYFEVDAEMIAYRQVTVMNDCYRVSIAPDFLLAEKEIELFEGDEEISQ